MKNLVPHYQSFATEAHLRDLYIDRKHSQQEIAEFYGTNQKQVWKALKFFGIKTRVASKRDQTGVKNHMWKEDALNLGYATQHRRVEKARGKPQNCVDCGTTDPRKRYEWANLTGKYEDITDYKRLCSHCHRLLDKPTSKRDPEMVRAIRRDHDDGILSQKQMMHKYNCCASTISTIGLRKAYSWILEEVIKCQLAQ